MDFGWQGPSCIGGNPPTREFRLLSAPPRRLEASHARTEEEGATQDSQDRRRRPATRFGVHRDQNQFLDVCDPLRQGGSPRDTILRSARKPMEDFVGGPGRFQNATGEARGCRRSFCFRVGGLKVRANLTSGWEQGRATSGETELVQHGAGGYKASHAESPSYLGEVLGDGCEGLTPHRLLQQHTEVIEVRASAQNQETDVVSPSTRNVIMPVSGSDSPLQVSSLREKASHLELRATVSPIDRNNGSHSPSSLGDTAVADHQNLVGSDDGGQPFLKREKKELHTRLWIQPPREGMHLQRMRLSPVSDDHRGAVDTDFSQRGLDVAFRLRVQGRRGLQRDFTCDD
ncbi:hypothetical protein EYF80_038318 [Liparis tanakae]|uniref:Uncharacterized protein n=1 Tax=Liparis tanakae TaxID=230148 RepID=A0A4Z2GD45_9TELE|nr:hypothetical protein EYF80_038318 [Liparis tanakae]